MIALLKHYSKQTVKGKLCNVMHELEVHMSNRSNEREGLENEPPCFSPPTGHRI